MQASEAKMIIDTLASGVAPATGELLSDDSPVNQPQVIRALFMASQALQADPGVAIKERVRIHEREMAGKPWSEEEEKRSLEAFDAGKSPRELAVLHRRKVGGIESRLVRHGRLSKVLK